MTAGHTRALELLDGSLGYTRVALSTVGPDRSGPTPCAGWSLADLLAHMDDGLDAFLEAAGGAVRVEVPRRPGADLEVLQTKACHLLGVWSGRAPAYVVVGDRPAPSPVIVAAAALEIAVHGWDVGAGDRASGHHLPDDLGRGPAAGRARRGRAGGPAGAVRRTPGARAAAWVRPRSCSAFLGRG